MDDKIIFSFFLTVQICLSIVLISIEFGFYVMCPEGRLRLRLRFAAVQNAGRFYCLVGTVAPYKFS